MKITRIALVLTMIQLGVTSSLFAQAFGEYGRTVGSIPHGGGMAVPKVPVEGNPSRGGSSVGGIGNVGGKGFPSRLVVATKDANLYPKQDDESEKVAQLPKGEILVPMVQSSGGNDWYMVKTQKGMVGWIKSTDVREDRVKK